MISRIRDFTTEIIILKTNLRSEKPLAVMTSIDDLTYEKKGVSLNQLILHKLYHFLKNSISDQI